MALSNKVNNNPHFNVINDKPQETQENPIQAEQPEAATGSSVKRKKGRPATKDRKNTCKQVSICLPNDLLKQWDDVKAVCGGNFTDYITRLMSRDMSANYDKRMESVKKLNEILAEADTDKI